MILLEANDIKHAIQDRLLFHAANLKVGDRDRIGIVGLNGAGKTTLLNVLAGNLIPDHGHVETRATRVIIPQFKPNPGQLSGGEVTARYLENALKQEPALLLADEPTMHLDADRIRWLEDQFAQFTGALIIVSHDRAFLDRICTHIWELENKTITVYKGNYSDYAEAKELKIRQQEERYKAYVDKRQQLTEAITAKSRKAAGMMKPPKRMGNKEARLGKDRKGVAQKGVHQAIKALETRIEKLDKVEKPREQPTIRLAIPGMHAIISSFALRVERLEAVYGERTLWRNVHFTIRKAAKAALIGPNGSGKTTLIRRIVAQGEGVRLAPGAKIGYFSQNLDTLDASRSVLDNVLDVSVQTDEMVRLILARLLFRGDDAFKPVGVLSGGEKVKAALARLIVSDVNFLVLDEPTNFLDIPSIEAVEQLLADYEGTLLFVSHDRRLVRRVADQIIAVRDGGVTSFTGTYDAYMEDLEKRAQNDNADEAEELLRVETKLGEVLGKLSMQDQQDALYAELDAQFRELAARRNELRRALGK